MRKDAQRIGVLAACLHVAAFIAIVFYVQRTADPQAALIWAKWRVIDFPVSLLYWLAGKNYSQWLDNQNPYLAQILYLPHLIHGPLATIWWFSLPRLLLPRRLGGIWGKAKTAERTDKAVTR
jgi:hypothetical protein